jgi:hypothetical protein
MNAVIAETLLAPSIPWVDLTPLLILLAGASFLLLFGALIPRWPRGGYAVVASASAITAAIMSMIKWNNLGYDPAESVLSGAINIDRFAVFGWITISIAIVLVSLITHDYLVREDQDGPEVYALYLTAAIGGYVMTAAGDLIVLFLGLEILSLSLYILAASNRRREESPEAVLHSWRLFLSVRVVWHRASLRCNGHHKVVWHCSSVERDGVIATRGCVLAHWHCVTSRWTCVQDCSGSIPCVDS